MRETPSNNSTATIGKDEHSRCEKTDMPTLVVVEVWASAEEAALVVVDMEERCEVALAVVVEDLVDEVATVVDTVAVVDMEAALVATGEEQDMAEVLEEAVVHLKRRLHPTPSPIMQHPEESVARSSTSATFPGPPATTTWSNSSPLSARSNVQKFSTSQTVDLRVVVWSNSTAATTAETAISKFTGYMYGGRPLGLSYVKYTNANGGEAMEGQEATGGMTQDQIM